MSYIGWIDARLGASYDSRLVARTDARLDTRGHGTCPLDTYYMYLDIHTMLDPWTEFRSDNWLDCMLNISLAHY